MSMINHRTFLADDSEKYDQSFVSWYICDGERFNDSTIYISDGEQKVQFNGDSAAQIRQLSRLHEQLGAFIVACNSRELDPRKLAE